MSQDTFKKALAVGRPPNVVKNFPNSQALIVSGKVIDRAMLAKGQCMTIAANGRNLFIIEGALMAAQKANAALIIEIARSEATYCPTTLWNVARRVDYACNKLGITIPVAVHADHYFMKKWDDVAPAKAEIPTVFESGVTSIAIDASHMTDDLNLLGNLAVSSSIPAWAGYETEIGEIKGEFGLSSPVEAKYLIQGLNAHGLCPDWIALNNGTTHGIEASGEGIQVELTAEIHQALKAYGTSGAQHGTSGNDSARLREIAAKTSTTKANVATALQMISWGVKVNEFGNAIMDGDRFAKVSGQGVEDALWDEMVAYADANGIKGGNYKKLNLVFERRWQGQAEAVRNRMSGAVMDFVYDLLVNVFNAKDTAPIACDLILEAGSYDLGPKAERFEDPAQWTEEKIKAMAAEIDTDKGPKGNFDD
ncbi:MAG: class II fructose-bisphosphate aldolase [Pseudodesulfovibrio sp.]|jgi:fructose/tagatose bisphosphate aldolase|uniref:Fructose/tagatose bisphosphate aldolase n=1 Tax=Pseudodesulfovibrio indicus TaxID=1716143 RepID=A0A126QM07_9BACT|nr:class II fructose-bisphosphate aldolase [Pseudodesulfovibrio indicus]AMK10718.1 ketose-bisphosphate aldolase [Pseudodesulfovibrio indicus]TDT91702.1 fructose/tagatose bisphosphate aldolase [Pseudodesulfovibrio indicus]